MNLRVRFFVSVVMASLGLYSAAVSAQAVASVQTTSAYRGAMQREINISLRDVLLPDALREIQRIGNLQIAYAREDVPQNHKVTIVANKITVANALDKMLQGTGLAVTAPSADKIVLVAARSRKVQGAIGGKVTDGKTGKGIFGASVSITSDNRTITTDATGSYRIVGVSTGTYTITARLVGYAKQTKVVTVDEGVTVTVDFRLELSASVLDQVVVTGTVVASELKAVPNAITVITAKQIEERGITRIDQLFRGEIPGLFSLERGTVADLDQVLMFSRGTTQVSPVTGGIDITNPIKTYVDGVELSDPQYLSQIDPKSIERIEILTGPQASTIYGANAMNGVMQIFTKRGNTTRPSITLSLVDGFAQNNLSSALSPSHQYDVSMSGMERNLSYNVGSGWDYTGAWIPGRQMQRTSVYGGGRYQSSKFSLDVSARQGWTRNRVLGANIQMNTTLAQKGKFVYSGNTGLVRPINISLSGRTFGIGLGYTPFSWWSNQINVGHDASDTQTLGTSAIFTSPSDTNISNNQSPGSRMSQSYSSTLRISVSQSSRITLTYGADHWRNRSSQRFWTVRPSGEISVAVSPSRNRPDKNTGAYMQGQFGLLDALFFTYGVRADWNPNFGEKTKVRPGRYGVSYARDMETPFGVISTKLRGSYGRSIKPPPANFLQGDPVTVLATIDWYASPGSMLYNRKPNPDLGPEFQQGGEGGVELYFGNIGSLVITRYNQTVEGLIANLSGVDSVRALVPGYPTGGGVSGCDPASTALNAMPRSDGYCYFTQTQNVNIGGIRNQGWELQGSVNAGPFTTRGTYSWVKSRVMGITSKYRDLLKVSRWAPGQTFNYIPEHTWAINISYANQGTSLALNVNGLGQTVRIATASELGSLISSNLRLRTEESYTMSTLSTFRQTQSGYATSNLNVTHRFSGTIEGTLQVANLTNYYRNDYQFQYPTLGRQTRLGTRIRF